MEMHQIRYFLALAEDLNFTKAAERCHVSQPSLTRAIGRLECEFGGALLRRERGNTHLTELGRMMLPHLREIATRAETAKRQAARLMTVARKRLRLGVMCTIAPQPLLALVTAMTKEHPDIDLEITDSTAQSLETMLQADSLDIALYCRPDHRDDRLHYLSLFHERMMIVVHPDDPLAAGKTVRFSDTSGRRYLNRINCEYNEGMAWASCGVVWEAMYRSERDDWILAMIAAGMGFGFLPEFCVTHPGVVARPVIEPEIERTVDIVTVRGRAHSAAVGAFVRQAVRNGWSAGIH